jgi:hypothetical protein
MIPPGGGKKIAFPGQIATMAVQNPQKTRKNRLPALHNIP